MSFFWQGRFGEKPSDLLKHYYADALRQPIFLQALHAWDKAQVVVLAEQKLAPLEALRCLLSAIDAMEAEGVVEARAAQWNVIHGGEEYMRKHCDEDSSGWLHLGRSSPSIRVVATRIAFRKLQMETMASINELRQTLIDVSKQHVETLMPGYSYIQQNEPSTLGYYLMSWVEPMERDFQRCLNTYRNTNISSVGTGGAYGIEFDIDLARLDELLGFEGVPCNARDSIRNYDYLIETYMALALLHNTLGRLAMDFLIWHSMEFDYIELPERLSISSSVCPQMRVPYVLEFIHGTSGLLTGRLMQSLAITKTASDQLEMATMLPAEFWRCAEESRYAISALCEALTGMRVNTERMAAFASDYWCQSTSLVAYLVNERGMSFRTAHQILSKLMRKVVDKGVKPSELPVEWIGQEALAYTGKELEVTQAELNRVIDAMQCVRQRKYRAGSAPERVFDHVSEAERRLQADNKTLHAISDRILASERKLESAFAAVKKGAIQ
jgi:argininosuccinate lyase